MKKKDKNKSISYAWGNYIVRYYFSVYFNTCVTLDGLLFCSSLSVFYVLSVYICFYSAIAQDLG